MEDKITHIADLIFKFLQKSITADEQAALDQWKNESEVNSRKFESFIEGLNSGSLVEDLKIWEKIMDGKNKRWEHIRNTIEEKSRSKNFRSLFWWRYAAAIIFIVMLAGSLYLWMRPGNDAQLSKSQKGKAVFPADRSPGSDGAILQLANGTKVMIDSSMNGNIAIQGSTKIMKRDGVVLYNLADEQKSNEILYNTLTTPRARQIQLALPDGSKAWLNASSSITFPAKFTGNQRMVRVTGEVYFEVAQVRMPGSTNKIVPFIVSVDSMEVEVLGTHFNINAYPEELQVKTTLLEGLVKISSHNQSRLLRPNQQAIVHNSASAGNSDGTIKIIDKADVVGAVAWKNGLIVFDRSDVKAILRQISRWYDVDILYADNIPTEEIRGTIPRNMKLKEALQALELSSGLKFSFQNSVIIVGQQK